jgi:hypothetical protein
MTSGSSQSSGQSACAHPMHRATSVLHNNANAPGIAPGQLSPSSSITSCAGAVEIGSGPRVNGGQCLRGRARARAGEGQDAHAGLVVGRPRVERDVERAESERVHQAPPDRVQPARHARRDLRAPLRGRRGARRRGERACGGGQ